MSVILRANFAMPGPLAYPVVARQADQSSGIGTPSGTTTEILIPSSSTELSTAPAPVPTYSWIDCHTYDRSCDVPNIGVWRCPDNSLVDLSATCPPLIIPWTACHDPPTASNGCKVDPIGVERRWGCADGSSVSEDEKCPEADPSRKVPGSGTPSSSGGGGGEGFATSPTAGSGDGQRTGGQQGSEGQGGGGQVGQQEPTGQTAGQGASVQATGAGVAATTKSVTFGAPGATSATFRVSTLGTAGTSRSGIAAQSSSAANPADGSYGWRKASTLSAVAIVLFLGLGFAVTV